MNSTKCLFFVSVLKQILPAGMVLLLVACRSVAVTSTSLPVDETPTALLPTATLELSLTPINVLVVTPTEEVVYPYYLPLVTKLENVSQTIGDVTTKIDWAYVDDGRVAIQYTISGLNWPDGSSMDPTQQVQMSIPAISDFQFGGFNGGSAGNVSSAQNGAVTGSSDQSLFVGALDAEKYPEISVRVSIPVEGPTKVGTFHLNFTVPVVNGIRIENIDQTVVANNVAMTLKSLIVNPSRVDALICFQMPSAVDWGLMSSKLNINGKEYSFSGGGAIEGTSGKGFSLSDPERCSSIGFDIIYDESAASIILTVPKLVASVNELVTKEVIDRANQRLADKGIQFDYENVDHGGNIVILKRPNGATDQEIYPLIWDALADQYEGPWAFTVPIK